MPLSLLVSYRDALWLLRSFENLNFDDAQRGRVPRVRQVRLDAAARQLF